MDNDDNYWVDENTLLVRYPLIAIDGTVHGYLFASAMINELGRQKDAASHLKKNIELIWQLNILFVISALMAVALYLNMRQKSYYRDILNYEQEVVLVTDGNRMIDANRQLFKYFPDVDGKKVKCICDFFEAGPGLLQKMMGDTLWIDYVVANPQQQHKVLTRIDGIERVFNLRATFLGSNKNVYVAVLSDITQLENLNNKLHAQSRSDDLTGLGNRLSFNETLERESLLSIREQKPLSIILFDIDYFKKVNDSFGHLIGDDVLADLAKLVKTEIRASDLIFRIGGEEFMLLMPNQNSKEALALAEKIRCSVVKCHFKKVGSITISLGVTEYKSNEHLNDLLARVDKALYKAKDNGRNQTQLIE